MPDESFKEFVLDQLRALPEVRARAMFGAHGLYQGDSFFAILDEGRLFFKTDAVSQADYVARGMGPFTYESKGRVLTMSYHESTARGIGKRVGTGHVGAAGHQYSRPFEETGKNPALRPAVEARA